MVVAGDESPFGGRQRHVELSLGVLAVDLQWPGYSDRHLGYAREVLDVSGQNSGVERELPDVVEASAGLLAQELAALCRDLGRVIVFLVSRGCEGRW